MNCTRFVSGNLVLNAIVASSAPFGTILLSPRRFQARTAAKVRRDEWKGWDCPKHVQKASSSCMLLSFPLRTHGWQWSFMNFLGRAPKNIVFDVFVTASNPFDMNFAFSAK